MSIRTDGKLVTSKKGRSDARVAVGQAIEIAGDELTPIRRKLISRSHGRDITYQQVPIDGHGLSQDIARVFADERGLRRAEMAALRAPSRPAELPDLAPNGRRPQIEALFARHRPTETGHR
jgi:hypothetical protein